MKGMRNIAPLGIRLPEELKEKIQEQAKVNGRSTNAEIVTLLEQSVGSGSAKESKEELEKIVESYEEQVKQLMSMIKVQRETIDLAYEQIALLKQHIKLTTGIDINEFFRKKIDYDAIKNKNDTNKKPT
ncbi:Arc-like DNA binding domain [Serratia marcescens]|uniref:Arc family DNA-binding protein n=1 Tax=Serratia marcescens TaxID=615 RepID=UPI0007455132|nr:Arc family DNA-binding protein [Serratia marcescens]CVE50057.1 Arc-like DNA binding domain [Serratia marcescens]